MHLDNKTLATSSNADMVLLLPAAQHCLTNADRRKKDFPIYALYKAGTQYVNLLRAHFTEMRSHNQFSAALFRSDAVLGCEIILSKFSKIKIRILDSIANGMNFVWGDQGVHIEQFEHVHIVRQKRAMNQLYKVLFRDKYGRQF